MTISSNQVSKPPAAHFPHIPGLREGLVVSILIHILLMGSLLSFPSSTGPAPTSMEFDVLFIEPEARRPQIVSPPPESLPVTPPASTQFESERESAAPIEQVKRAPPGGSSRQASPSVPTPPAARQGERSTTRPPTLLLDSGTTLSEFGSTTEERNPHNENSIDQRSYQAFSRPSGSGAAVLGLGGTMDYLPNLPDGDITLLNAKANQFAVFVRRVAERVFSRLRIEGWEGLASSDIRKVRDFAEVRATLSIEGKLLSVTIQSASGSPRFDSVVERAVRGGASDPHPPEGAVASDGKIHFIFRAKSWSRGALAPRSGAPYERRWLLLSTGLE